MIREDKIITDKLGVTQTSPPSEPIQLSLSLEEALHVIWTPKGHFRPIGELLKSRTITDNDLIWAAIYARSLNPRIKEAARTVLAHKLMVPTVQMTDMGRGPSVITGSKYLQHNERWSLAEFSFILGFALASVIMLGIIFVQEWSKGTLTIPVLIVFLVLLSLALRMINKESRRAYREYETFRKGREGEDQVAERVVADLDGRWTIFRNFILPGRKDDIDLLLVGPGGVLALEVKTYGPGTRAAQPTPTSRFWGRKQSSAPASLESQATSKAAQLKQLLAQRKCEIAWVQPVLVFAAYRPADFITTGDALQVWSGSEIDDRLLQIRSMARLSGQQVEKVVAELESMRATA